MIAVLGGLIAACTWGTSTLFASRAARQIGPASTLAWVGIVGVTFITPIALWYGIPFDATWTDLGLLLAAGVGSAFGLRLTYAALARGKVGVVVAITSTEGAVAALIAVIAGERLGLLGGIGIAVATLGVMGVGLGRHVDDSDHVARDNRRAALTASGAALVFGSSLWASGDVAQRVGGPWVVFSARITAVLTIAIPLLLRRQLQYARPGILLAGGAGLIESIGFLGFLWGAAGGLGIAAVVATQYATVATLLSWIFLHERLSRLQITGVATVIAGVILLTVSRSV